MWDWADITSLATQNLDLNYFLYNTTTFSGFAIKEYVAPVAEEETPPIGGGSAGGCVRGYELVDGTCTLIEEEVDENVSEITEELFDITFILDYFVIQDSSEL